MNKTRLRTVIVLSASVCTLSTATFFLCAFISASSTPSDRTPSYSPPLLGVGYFLLFSTITTYDDDSFVVLETCTLSFGTGGTSPLLRKNGPLSRQSSTPKRVSSSTTIASSSSSTSPARNPGDHPACRGSAFLSPRVAKKWQCWNPATKSFHCAPSKKSCHSSGHRTSCFYGDRERAQKNQRQKTHFIVCKFWGLRTQPDLSSHYFSESVSLLKKPLLLRKGVIFSSGLKT